MLSRLLKWLNPPPPPLVPPPVQPFSVQYCDSELDRLCNLKLVEQIKQQSERGEIPEKHIHDISTYLDVLDDYYKRSGKARWGSRPRLYAILHIIHGLNLMDPLAKNGETDYSLPFTEYSFPTNLPTFEDVDESDIAHLKRAFIQTQSHFFTGTKGIEEESSKHYIFAPDVEGDFYFIPRKKLGQGSFGSVDQVFSRLSLKSYARKRVVRGRSLRAAECQQFLVNELEALRTLKHDHLVQIIGSYTDKEYIAYIMLPVAQRTLRYILDDPRSLNPDHKALVRHAYGCLAGALNYLHEKKIRHRDLSPNNILVHNGEVYISDFGSAYSWANKSGSQTRHRDTPACRDYMAPEVAKDEYHGTASDVWSLGIIFLEMTTRLLGYGLKGYRDAISSHARKNKVYPHAYANIPALVNWLDDLSKIDSDFHHDKEPLAWTRNLIHSQQEHRPSTRLLMQDMLGSSWFDLFCCFKCRDAYQSDFGPNTFIKRNPPSTGTFSTFSTVQDMLDRTENTAPFGGLSNNKLGSIKEWTDTLEVSYGAGSNTGGGEMAQYGSRNFDARYSLKAMYGNYEADLLAQTPIQHPNVILKNKGFSDLNRSKKIDETPCRMATSWRSEESSGEHKLPSTQGLVGERLGNHGPGYLEREGVSFNNERSMMFDEVSDCSTDDEDLDISPSLHGPNGSLQPIKEDCESFGVISDDLDGLDQFSTNNPDDILPQGLGFDEISDKSDSDTTSSDSGETEALPCATTPDVLVSVEQDDDAMLSNSSDFPNDKSRSKPRVGNNSLPSQESAKKKATRCESDPTPTSVLRGTHIPEATLGKFVQEHDSTPVVEESSQEIVQRRRLSKRNLEKLKEDNKRARTARNPKPREKCIGVNAIDFMSHSWDKASSAPTSNMSEAAKSKLSLALFSFTSQRDALIVLNNHCKDGKVKAVRIILQILKRSGTQIAKYHGPLWSAVKGASERHNKCVRELISAGVAINITSRRTGKSPLHVAVDHADFKGYAALIWLLVNANADLDALDWDGDSPMMKLFLGNDSEPLGRHRRDALAILLRAGARVDVRQRATGSTPLHFAVRRQDKWAVAMLLSKGANVNAKTSSGTTPLQITANQFRGNLSSDHAEVLHLLLQHKDIQVDEPAGVMQRTALHLAVISGTAHAVEMLVQRGASTEMKDKQEDNAIILGVQHAAKLVDDQSKTQERRLDDHVEIMRLLTEKESKWPLFESKCVIEVACKNPDSKLLKELLRRKLNPNDNFGDHGTILEYVSKHGTHATRESLSRFFNTEG